MILAQATPAAPSANMVLLVVTFLISGAAGIATILMAWYMKRQLAVMVDTMNKTGSPQPFLIAMEKEFVSKPEFHAHVTRNQLEHDNFFSKLGGVERGAANKLSEEIRAMREERRADTSELHDKINSVAVDVGGLKTGMDLINQNLALLIAERRKN